MARPRKIAVVTATGPGGVLRGRVGDVPRFHADDFNEFGIIPPVVDGIAREQSDAAYSIAYDEAIAAGENMFYAEDSGMIACVDERERLRREWLRETLDDRVGML